MSELPQSPTSRPSKVPTARRVLVVSFLVDLFDITSNFVVVLLTGSAVIFAEMSQGIADAIGSALLVIGERRSRRPVDPRYPGGHGREVFFWALLSSMVMLTVGSGLSFWRGYTQLVRLEPLDRPYLALGILLVSVATNGYAMSQSIRRLWAPGSSLIESFRNSSHPLVKTSLLRDGLGTGSAVLGLVSLVLYSALGSSPFIDGVGAIAIGMLMVVFAIVLIVEVHQLIIGRPVPDGIHASICDAIRSVPDVEAINSVRATFAGSDEIVVHADLDLQDSLSTNEVEEELDRIELAVKAVEPRVNAIHVDLNSPSMGTRSR